MPKNTPPPTDAYAVRLENVRRLMAQYDGPTNLARRLGHKSGSQLAQCAGPHPTRPIGEVFARGIEDKLGLPRGWLDQPHDGHPVNAAVPLNTEMLARAMLVVDGAVGTRKITQEQRYALVSIVYDRLSAAGAVDDAFVRQLVAILG